MTFLTAEWRKLLMANYVVPPEILEPYVPAGTELDFWQGRCYASLVGFMFLKTRILGLSIPFHRDFEEVNLRFYVRRKVQDEWRRGVVFIKEIVPKPAITWVANAVYREHYATCSMRHHWASQEGKRMVSYEWKPFFGKNWYRLAATAASDLQPILPRSEEEFITEHYWGYSKAGQDRSNEYQVEHPRWEVYPVTSYDINGDFGKLYGSAFAAHLAAAPVSVFIAEGSPVRVMRKAII